MAENSALGPASISLGSTTSAFIAFLPSFTEVRRAAPDDEGMTKDIHLGQIAAIAVSMGTAVIVSSLSGSPAPVVAAAIMSAVLVWCYRNARNN